MAQVTLSIGGYSYGVACRDGEEPHLLALGAAVDAKVAEAIGTLGGASESRGLLFAALLFADELIEAKKGGTEAPSGQVGLASNAPELEAIATRLEKLAESLEKATD
jgi:cell division protein ZapA